MAYDYYCMYCGRLLKQETVLFDLQHLLTRAEEQKFALLKFRLTAQEFKSLIARGTPSEAGYRECKFTFPEIMQIISNEHNLNDKEIAALTLQDIQAYLNYQNTVFSSKAKKPDKSKFIKFDAAKVTQEETKEETETVEYERPASILALEAQDKGVDDRAFTANKLKPDLTALQSLFAQSETMVFRIREMKENDNDGKPVLVGCDVHIPMFDIYMSLECRVCFKCDSPVFSHAGTAKHQAISFIGRPASGKTSTILALTHYATNGMMTKLGEYGDEGTQIWKDSEIISSVATIELLDKNERLSKDLIDYAEGFAPPKTEANERKNAYCATFRIKNNVERKYYLFTLTDLPGELCLADGTVDTKKVKKDFQVALSCDAFVACFDTQNINPNGAGVTSEVLNVCKWADKFQDMRASHNGVKTYVPTMLLYTKCLELEDGEKRKQIIQDNRQLMPIQQTYSLRKEKLQIGKNPLYGFVSDQFNESEHLSKAYHAMLRCSPFGQFAPSREDVEKDSKLKNETPKPQNVDVLMRWLLSVAGCIPTEGEYRRSPADPAPRRLNDYCISRPQLRSENPMREQDIDESLARCVLFENPGYFDEHLLAKYDAPWSLLLVRGEAKLRAGTNAR